MSGTRESMPFDVVIVGGGPAGLAAAIRLRQLSAEHGKDVSVCLVEKGAEIGSHVLSGNVFDPIALDELVPDWRERGAPLTVPAIEEQFLMLTEGGTFRLPTPPGMRGDGCWVISLGRLCRWLASEAESLGVEVFPGFPASELLADDSGRITGVVTGDMGRLSDGSPGPTFEAGVELHAPLTLLAEGCRGSLSEEVICRFSLDRDSDPQTYGLGIKELWEVSPEHHHPGRVIHTVGWPLDQHTYGGGFLYHMDANLVAVGMVVGLDYANPYLEPFEEMQRLKLHPAFRPIFESGRRVAYGARALVEGGLQALPRLAFPGGALIGDGAGFLDVPRIKGAHTAMKSGMLAAEAAFAALAGNAPEQGDLDSYPEALRRSWVWSDLYRSRNIRPGFRWGLWAGLTHAAIDTYVLRGRAPWTLHHHSDHESLRPVTHSRPIAYPTPDGTVTFDKTSSVYLSGTNHRDDQPCHLKLADETQAVTVNLSRFGGPEARYCPAGVYEFVDEGGGPRLRINAQNCLHCKTCDIKDPTQNITWVPPEGGGGPNYSDM